MKSLLNTQVMLSLHLLLVVVIIVIASWSLSSSKSELHNKLQKNIDEQIVTLDNLLNMTNDNRVDSVVSEIITDCTKRSQFEKLLGSLASLGKSDLVTVQQLFESCGGFYAEGKSLMVFSIEREFEVLLDNIEMLSVLEKNNHSYDSIADNRGSIVDLEKNRSALLNERVVLQRDIIQELISGTNVNSSEISTKTSRAQDVSELLTVIDRKIDVLREVKIEK